MCIGAIWVAFDNNLFVWQSKPWSNYCLSRVKRIKVKVDWLKNSCHQSIYFECFVCFASTISCSLSHPMASSSIARVLLAVFAVQVKQIHIFRTHTEYWANLWETQNNCSSNLTSFPFALLLNMMLITFLPMIWNSGFATLYHLKVFFYRQAA